jgi:hypothetical protein
MANELKWLVDITTWVGHDDAKSMPSFKIGDVGWGNYVDFSVGGFQESFGDAISYDDQVLPLSSWLEVTSPPDAVTVPWSTLVKAHWFDGNNKLESLHFSQEMQHGYKEWTDVELHLHWMPSTANTWDVKRQVEIGRVDSATWAISFSTLTWTTAANWTAWATRYTSFGTLTWTWKTIRSQFVGRLFRNPSDAADTYPDDAIAVTLWIHYQKDTSGSRTISTK